MFVRFFLLQLVLGYSKRIAHYADHYINGRHSALRNKLFAPRVCPVGHAALAARVRPLSTMFHNHNLRKESLCLVLVLVLVLVTLKPLIIAIAWLEALAGNGPKADPHNYDFT